MQPRLFLLSLLLFISATAAAAQTTGAPAAPEIGVRISGLIATASGFGVLMLGGLFGAYRNRRAGRLVTNGWRIGTLLVLGIMGIYITIGVSQGGEIMPWLVRGCGQGIFPLLFGAFLTQKLANQQEIEALRAAEEEDHAAQPSRPAARHAI